jgi:hypothetical protein
MTDETLKSRKTTEVEQPKKRDKWERLQIAGQLLLPILIAGFGFYITNQDKAYQEQKLKTERVMNLLDHLANKEEKPNLVALAVLSYFQQRNEVNDDLVDAVTGAATSSGSSPKVVKESEIFLKNIVNSNASDTTKANAEKGLDKISNDKSAKKLSKPVSSNSNISFGESATKSIDAPATNSLVTVYLHYLKDTNSDLVSKIQTKLKEQKINAPGIEGVLKVRNQTQIRYFAGGANTNSDLLKIQDVLKSLGIEDPKPIDISDNYPNSDAKPRVYEIWLGTNDNK